MSFERTFLTHVMNPRAERVEGHVEHRETPESGNYENQPEGSQRSYPGDCKVEHLAKENCGGSEEEISAT